MNGVPWSVKIYFGNLVLENMLNNHLTIAREEVFLIGTASEYLVA